MSGEGVIASEPEARAEGRRSAGIALTTPEIEELCKAVKAALDASPSPLIGKAFTGPRHNEVGFETRDGAVVVLSLRGHI